MAAYYSISFEAWRLPCPLDDRIERPFNGSQTFETGDCRLFGSSHSKEVEAAVSDGNSVLEVVACHPAH